ncbi:MAG: hypothetical protein ABIH69_06085 [bacterium]
MKQRVEILLKEIRGDVKLALEDHDVLRSEMGQMGTGLRSEMRQMEQRLNGRLDRVHSSLKNEIMVTGLAISDKLDEHIKQPAHS